MRTRVITWAFAFLFPCLACKEDGNEFQLPDSLFVSDKIYDIGNNGNATDVRVEISVSPSINTADLIDVRLVIVKASSTFGLNESRTLTTGNFFSAPISSSAKQVIKPGNIKDAEGNAVINGTAYKIYIVAIGKDNATQLSNAIELTLLDKPIFAGNYLGTWEDLGPPGPASFPITLKINNDYTGSLFYTPNFVPYGRGAVTEDVKTTLVVTGATFTFQMNQLIGQYVGNGAFGSNGGCPASKNLSGTIQDDFTLIFTVFNWSDCDGTRDVRMKFTRQ
jgi:hypothetical protein